MAVCASVDYKNNFEGLFRLTISCNDYKLQYFLAPISLEANFRTAVEVPELTVTSSMLGHCTIIGDLTTNENLILDEKESNSFEATNKLIVLPVSNKIISLPAGSIQIVGIVNEAYGNNVLKASAKMTLDNSTYEAGVEDGKFNITIELTKNIKSGKHTIEISAIDSKDNIGNSNVELEITAVPSYIKTELNSDNLLPGSNVDILSSLFDQADDLINVSLDLELKDPKGDKIFRKVVKSHEKIAYEFSQYAEPGAYVLESTYNNLHSKSEINVSAVKEVKVKYDNENVFIENIGNVPFEDELTFILETGLKKYPITKTIKIDAGKVLNVDLSKEVPLGIYNIIFPLKEGISPIKKKINETIQNAIDLTQEEFSDLFSANESLLASDVTIHDNRPLYRKIQSGFSSLSGSLVGSDGLLSRNPFIAPTVLIIVILLIVVRYGRKPMMKLFKKEKNKEN